MIFIPLRKKEVPHSNNGSKKVQREKALTGTKSFSNSFLGKILQPHRALNFSKNEKKEFTDAKSLLAELKTDYIENLIQQAFLKS